MNCRSWWRFRDFFLPLQAGNALLVLVAGKKKPPVKAAASRY
jgi:hypothetical protein